MKQSTTESFLLISTDSTTLLKTLKRCFHTQWTFYKQGYVEEKLAGFILVVDVVSYLILQVYMSPNGEEKLYHTSVTPDNGPHAGSHAILRNKR